MQKNLNHELKVGFFISFGIFLVMLAVFFLEGNQSLFKSPHHYFVYFKNVQGLLTGARVILSGVPVGTVENISFHKKKRAIQVKLSVTPESSEWIRKNATADIATQGVLGDKFINIVGGSENDPILPPNSEIMNETSHDFSHLLDKGDQLIVVLQSIALSIDQILKTFNQGTRSEQLFNSITSTAKNLARLTEKIDEQLDGKQLKELITSLNQVIEKVNIGAGTLGALVNDPSIYDEIKALLGGVNRNRIIRNLVRKTLSEPSH